MKRKEFFLTFLVIFFLANMIFSPAVFLQAGLDGLSAFALCVLPCIFPFMFFTRILSSLKTFQTLARPFSGIAKIFNTPPISIPTFFLAILSGYPVGSKMVANLFMQGKISKEEAFRMTAFCSTSGPMFIVGAVGVGMFGSSKIGYILFVSHILGAIANGIFFRNLRTKKQVGQAVTVQQDKKEETTQKTRTQKHLSTVNSTEVNRNETSQTTQNEKTGISEIIIDCTQAVLNVGGIITIFFIIIQCFSPLLSLLPNSLNAFCSGLIEITKGCNELSKISGILPILLCSFVISFGGISTIIQSLTMLTEIKMPVKLFVFQKLTHAIFSTIFTTVLILLV